MSPPLDLGGVSPVSANPPLEEGQVSELVVDPAHETPLLQLALAQ
jgi:hypothetical protein